MRNPTTIPSNAFDNRSQTSTPSAGGSSMESITSKGRRFGKNRLRRNIFRGNMNAMMIANQIDNHNGSRSESDSGSDDYVEYGDSYTIEEERSDDETTLDDTTLDTNTVDDTLTTMDGIRSVVTEKSDDIDWASIGNILSEHTTQFKNKITTELGKALPQIGQKVQEQFSQVMSGAQNDQCGTLSFERSKKTDARDDDQNSDFDDENDHQDKENSDSPRVQSILKNPDSRKFNQTPSPSSMRNSYSNVFNDNYSSSGLSKITIGSAFEPDWSQFESEAEKANRELREARTEIESLKCQLKAITKEKKNAESQLEFAKLALESFSEVESGSFSQVISSPGMKPTKTLRRPMSFFQQRFHR